MYTNSGCFVFKSCYILIRLDTSCSRYTMAVVNVKLTI